MTQGNGCERGRREETKEEWKEGKGRGGEEEEAM